MHAARTVTSEYKPKKCLTKVKEEVDKFMIIVETLK